VSQGFTGPPTPHLVQVVRPFPVFQPPRAASKLVGGPSHPAMPNLTDLHAWPTPTPTPAPRESCVVSSSHASQDARRGFFFPFPSASWVLLALDSATYTTAHWAMPQGVFNFEGLPSLCSSDFIYTRLPDITLRTSCRKHHHSDRQQPSSPVPPDMDRDGLIVSVSAAE
jgi:hypothetical protein